MGVHWSTAVFNTPALLKLSPLLCAHPVSWIGVLICLISGKQGKMAGLFYTKENSLLRLHILPHEKEW